MVGQGAKGRCGGYGDIERRQTRYTVRGRGSDQAWVPPHPTAMYAIAKKCVEALEVHRAGWGGSGAGSRTLEDRYGACLSIRPWSWWTGE